MADGAAVLSFLTICRCLFLTPLPPHTHTYGTLTIAVYLEGHVGGEDVVVADGAVVSATVLVLSAQLQDLVEQLALRHLHQVGVALNARCELVHVAHLDVHLLPAPPSGEIKRNYP